MNNIEVQPVENNTEQHSSFHLDLTLRVRVLDVVTGQPLARAYATKPAFDAKKLDAFGMHPLRVLAEREVQLDNTSTGLITLNIKGLRTFVPDPSGSALVSALKPTWQCTPEFVYTKPGRLISKDGSHFQRVDDSEDRFVCIKSAKATYAERALVTTQKGILEIPVSGPEWLANKTLELAFRDYMIIEAKDDYDADAPHQEFTTSLEGAPKDNGWKLERNGTKTAFEESIKIETSLLWHLWNSARGEAEVTIWAVRKVVEYSGTAKTTPVDRPAGTVPKGIVIHYNSGRNMIEKRGSGTVECAKVFDDSGRSVLRDNDAFGLPELALQIIKGCLPSLKYGYHHHVARNGEIWFVVDEDKRTYHAGASREPSTTDCRTTGDDGAPTTHTHTRTSPSENLNNTYIGIDILGYHDKAKFHFTGHQLWYLDRLIENICSRYDDVAWYNILGHDEVRTAYNTAHPASTEVKKTDPGSALPGGMEGLRGRHYSG